MKLKRHHLQRSSSKAAWLAAMMLFQSASASSLASTGKTTSSTFTTSYAPDVDIFKTTNFGPSLRGSRDVHQYGTLIAVNGEYVRGKTVAQINKLLSGGASTKVECTFLDQNEVKKVTLTRDKVVQANGNPFVNSITGPPISPKLDVYPGTYRRFTIADTLDNYSGSSPEIAWEAAEKTKIERIRNLPLSSPWILSVNLVKAMTAYDRMGHWKAAEQCIDSLNADGYFSSSAVTGMQFQNQIRSNFTELVQDFKETGRYALLCKIFTQMKSDTAASSQPYSEFYFEALTRRGDLSASERADLLNFAKETLAGLQIGNSFQMGDDLERVGEFATASKFYARMLELNKTLLSRGGEPETSNQRVSEVAMIAYRLASAQQKSGELKAAIATTTEMLSKYDSLVPGKLQEIDEQLDTRFPRRSDLEIQLANFLSEDHQLGEAEKYAALAINRIQQAVGEHNSSLKTPYEVMYKIAIKKKDNVVASQCLERLKQLDIAAVEHGGDSQAEYALVQTATKSIDQNELSKALTAIRALLSIYKSDEQDRVAVAKSLNLLTALTLQARALADHGYLTESDSLLKELYATFKQQNPPNSVCVELNLELLLNKDLREKISGGIWEHSFPATSLFEHDLIPKFMVLRNDAVVPMQQQEILREQAMAYEFAGDLKRANMIVDHALAYRELKLTGNDDEHKLSDRVVSILLLDKARLRAKAKAFDEAQSFAKEALKIYADIEGATYPLTTSPPYDAPRIATFEKLIRNKSVALARVLIDSDKLQDAGQLLETLQSQIEPNQGQNNWVFQGPDSENAGYEWMVAANIADVYLREHIMGKANMWLDKALAVAGSRPSKGLLILAAEMAVAEGDHKKAEAFYKKAAECGEFLPVFAYHDEYTNALFAASKKEAAYAQGSGEEQSIDASIAHAKELEQAGKTADSLAEYRKAFAALAENDKRRLDIRISTLALERNLAGTEKLKKTPSTTTLNTPPQKMTPAEEEKQKVDNALAEIADLKELVKIAEKVHSDLEWTYWIGLAHDEVLAKDPKNAASYAYKFLEMCPPEKKTILFYVFDPLSIAIEVSNQQNNNDGEGIIRAHIKSFGDKRSLSKAADLYLNSELLAYYMGVGKYDEAKAYMPKLLQGSGLAIGDQWHSQSTFQRISPLGFGKLPHEQQVALDKQFIEIEKKELPVDALVLATILKKLAADEAEAGMTQQAIRDFLEAQRIEEKYTGLASASNYKYWLEPLLVKTGDLNTLEIIKEKCKKPSGYLDPERPHEYSDKTIDKDAPLAKKMEQAENEYSLAKKQAIYSFRCEYALNNVVKYAEEGEQWQKAVDAHLLLCDWFEHSSQTDAQFQEAHYNNLAKRVKYYLPTVDAYLKLNDKPKAVQVIVRALKILPDVSCYESAELGMAAFKAGDMPLAEKLALRSESLLKNDASWNGSYEKLSMLWKALGHEDKAASVMVMQAAKRQQEEPKRAH
jgi:hypothetical protein